MGAGESKDCTGCQKEIKIRSVMPECHFCKKIVCTDCSNKEPLGPANSKVRVCHVCKVNQMNRQETDDGMLNVGKPKAFKKVINVKHDNKTGTYQGLPTIWRELLDMPLSQSQQEFDTSQLNDTSIAPVAPSKKKMYEIKEKNADGAYVISAPMSVQKEFQLKFDAKLGRVVGAPKELEPYLQGFKKEEIERNLEDVLKAAEMARVL